MHAQWVPSSTELPCENEPVEFVLDHREAPMAGIYALRTFRSHWTGYEAERVRTWRSSGATATAATPASRVEPDIVFA
jgi:hypothetical protein